MVPRLLASSSAAAASGVEDALVDAVEADALVAAAALAALAALVEVVAALAAGEPAAAGDWAPEEVEGGGAACPESAAQRARRPKVEAAR